MVSAAASVMRDPVPTASPTDRAVLFFDGSCGLCDRFVRFAFAQDSAGVLLAAPLDGETAAQLLAPFRSALHGVDSVVWYSPVPSPHVEVFSAAALGVLSALGGRWRMLASVCGIVPRPLRGVIYRGIAAVRYRVFGRADVCPVWPADWRARILP
jgi:predicted DCC family thiol-disulfide oxidoreductase YuxK